MQNYRDNGFAACRVLFIYASIAQDEANPLHHFMFVLPLYASAEWFDMVTLVPLSVSPCQGPELRSA